MQKAQTLHPFLPQCTQWQHFISNYPNPYPSVSIFGQTHNNCSPHPETPYHTWGNLYFWVVFISKVILLFGVASNNSLVESSLFLLCSLLRS